MDICRVLIVNHTTIMGGAEVGLAEWIRFLDRNSIDPTVVLPDAGPLCRLLRADGYRVEVHPLTRFTRSRNPLRLMRMAGQAVRQAAELARLAVERDIDVLHANSHAAFLVTALAARRTRLPCIWHVRDLTPLGWLGRWMYGQATAIVAISPAVASFIQQYRCGHDRVHLIPNGIDPVRFATASGRQAFRQSCFPGLPDEVLLIGMVGNLVPWKRHDLFLDLAEHLLRQPEAGFRFILIGDDRFGDHPEYASALRQRINSRALRGRVRMMGFCVAMPDVMQALDILVHPASHEPFGRVLVEAMSAAKPVVAVNDGGPADIVLDGDTGYLTPPADVEAMAAAVAGLAKKPMLRERMGREARRRAMKEFDVRRTSRDLTALYWSVGKGRP